MTRFASLLCTSILIAATFSQALAQDKEIKKADPCLVVAEEIIPLVPPNLDQAALWKKTAGVKGEDRARALLGVLDGGQIAIGESRAYDEKTGFGDRQIMMLRTDKTGKIVVKKWQPVKNLQAVSDAVLLKDRIAVLTQTGISAEDSVATLQFLNGVGEPVSSAVIHDEGRHLVSKSIVLAQGGEKLVVAAQSISNKNPADYNTVIFWLDTKGNVLDKKEYLPGVQNKPEFVGRLPAGGLVVTGRVITDDGREAGWVMALSAAGDIVFQRPYARGADSTIRRAIPYAGGIVTVGDTLPSGAGDKAAWVMKLDAKGNPLWQKYLTGKYIYSGVDLFSVPDGRVNVLMAGKPSSYGGRAHARVVTLSQSGQVIGDESFLEGSNAIPVRFIAQNGLRYLLGAAETGFSKGDVADDLKYITYDNWLLGMAPLPAYSDPCGKAPDRSLDD